MVKSLYPLESLYIHFPFCRHLCNYCDFYKSLKENEGQVQDFNEYFTEMFSNHENFLKKESYAWGPLKTLYIGGGTPSLWGLSGAELIQNLLREKLKGFTNNYEFTLEVNPGGWKKEELKAWVDAGVNRISFGVQSYNDLFLSHLDRVHRKKEINETLKYLQDLKINYSVDFMLGLPFSEKDKRNILEELNDILTWDPPHFSVYILTTKNQYIHKQGLPSEEWIENEYLEVSNLLKEKGYNHYEVSNFAKPGFESNHNLRYWRSESVAALGPSASGLLVEKNLRYKWKNKNLDFETEQLTNEQMNLEKIYLMLRTFEGIKGEEFYQNQQLDKFLKIKENWINNGLALQTIDSQLILNSKGMLQMDHLMNDLFGIA